MLRPEAKGKRPKIVVIAVNRTGLNLVFPPSITELLKSSLEIISSFSTNHIKIISLNVLCYVE